MLQLSSDTDPSAPQNPFRAARLALGLTQREIADQVGITPLSVLLSEQGCYTDPPVGLIRALRDLGKRAEWPAEALAALTLTNYTAWQRERRHYHGTKYPDIISWKQLELLNPSAFSKLLLVPLAVAQSFIYEGKQNPLIINAVKETFPRISGG